MTIVKHKKHKNALSDKEALKAWQAGEPFIVVISDVLPKGSIVVKGDITNVVYSTAPYFVGYELD